MMRIGLAAAAWAGVVCAVYGAVPVDAPAARPSDGPPASVHRWALEAHRDVPTSPDLLAAPGTPVLPLQTLRTADRPCATIFGYLPYWESSANLHWNLLTHLACFSVEVSSDGSISNSHSWPWTSLINTAHANGVKVILVATMFSDTSIATLLSNATYKNNFFVNIKTKMQQGSADGLNIDFEGTGTWIAQINAFMAELTAYLHTELPGSEVTFAGPAVNWSARWNLLGLAQSCDGIFIMGYAFAGSWSTVTGPNSPLTGGSTNITDTVLDEYYPVTQVLPEKLILGLPYYGHHWTTSTSDPRTTVVSFIGSTRFANDAVNSQTYGRLWDATSQTPWYRWQASGVWHQVWYDDAESLGLKYQLAQDHGLQGVGMWALNYDGTRPELWNELQARFRDACCENEVSTNGVALFADNFDAGTSAGAWTLFTSSNDYTADFAFDYSTRGIPPAPNSTGGTTRGVKFTVNKNDAVAAAAALSAYPAGRSFSGDYALQFDMWLNYNGGAGGGSGSTEFMLAGLNCSGTRVVWPNNAASDGYTFGVSGEGGAADDYRAYAGPTEYAIGSGVYVAESLNNTDPVYTALFPTPDYETLGVPGKHWVQVEVRQIGGTLEWRLNGTLLARISNPATTSGTALLGYMDPYASIANPAADNFIVYDNVRVIALPDPDCNANGVTDTCETPAAGDFDADGNVDSGDFAALVDCLAGPQTPPTPSGITCAPACRAAFDFDADADVDLADFAAFQRRFTLP
jgi:spore germination protein YaaH